MVCSFLSRRGRNAVGQSYLTRTATTMTTMMMTFVLLMVLVQTSHAAREKVNVNLSKNVGTNNKKGNVATPSPSYAPTQFPTSVPTQFPTSVPSQRPSPMLPTSYSSQRPSTMPPTSYSSQRPSTMPPTSYSSQRPSTMPPTSLLSERASFFPSSLPTTAKASQESDNTENPTPSPVSKETFVPVVGTETMQIKSLPIMSFEFRVGPRTFLNEGDLYQMVVKFAQTLSDEHEVGTLDFDELSSVSWDYSRSTGQGVVTIEGTWIGLSSYAPPSEEEIGEILARAIVSLHQQMTQEIGVAVLILNVKVNGVVVREQVPEITQNTSPASTTTENNHGNTNDDENMLRSIHAVVLIVAICLLFAPWVSVGCFTAQRRRKNKNRDKVMDHDSGGGDGMDQISAFDQAETCRVSSPGNTHQTMESSTEISPSALLDTAGNAEPPLSDNASKHDLKEKDLESAAVLSPRFSAEQWNHQALVALGEERKREACDSRPSAAAAAVRQGPVGCPNGDPLDARADYDFVRRRSVDPDGTVLMARTMVPGLLQKRSDPEESIRTRTMPIHHVRYLEEDILSDEDDDEESKLIV